MGRASDTRSEGRNWQEMEADLAQARQEVEKVDDELTEWINIANQRQELILGLEKRVKDLAVDCDKWQKIAEDAIAQRDAKWISEGVPEEGKPMLTVWCGQVQRVSYRREGDMWICADDDCDPAPVGTFTHWQPLPEPPLSQ